MHNITAIEAPSEPKNLLGSYPMPKSAEGIEDGALPVAYPGCIITYQKVENCGLVRATLTELRASDDATLVIGGARACLSCFLETVGAPFVFFERGERHSAMDLGDASKALDFIPAGRSVRAPGHGITVVRHLVLEFSPTLLEQIGLSQEVANLEDTRLRFSDPCLLMLCQIFASEVVDEQQSTDLFADSLGVALATRLSVIDKTQRNEQGGLAPWQYRRVVDYMMSRLGEQVSLEKLATLVQLSRSYFCRAFRETVGVTPYQWQLNARVHHAKSLILLGSLPLAQIALEAGFADQAHFTRVFRKFEGVCPGQWMRYHKQAGLEHSVS